MKKIVLVIVCLIIIKFVDAQSSLCFNSSTLTSNPVGANPAGITVIKTQTMCLFC
jgi:hypothetical protein